MAEERLRRAEGGGFRVEVKLNKWQKTRRRLKFISRSEMKIFPKLKEKREKRVGEK